MQNWMNEHLKKCSSTCGYFKLDLFDKQNDCGQAGKDEMMFSKNNNRWELMSFGQSQREQQN